LLKLNAVKTNTIIPDINDSISSSRSLGNSIFINEVLFELFDISIYLTVNRGNDNGKKRFPRSG
jgi:hypothetical protein